MSQQEIKMETPPNSEEPPIKDLNERSDSERSGSKMSLPEIKMETPPNSEEPPIQELNGSDFERSGSKMSLLEIKMEVPPNYEEPQIQELKGGSVSQRSSYKMSQLDIKTEVPPNSKEPPIQEFKKGSVSQRIGNKISQPEKKEEKLTVSEVGHRSQEILDSLREKYLDGLRKSNFVEGSSLTYYPDEERRAMEGLTAAAQYRFGYNPKFRFKALVRLVITHAVWMSTSQGEEKRQDDFAFNLRLLRKKKGQLSLLSYKEKMALFKRPSGRTDEEIEMLTDAFSKIKCFRGYSKDIHVGLAKAAVLYCFGANREVMRKGNPPTGLYLITSGEAATLKLHLDPLTLEASLVPSTAILPGQIFGELPLLYNEPRTISVITMTACEMVFWDKEFFDEVLLVAARNKCETIETIVSHFAYLSNWDEVSLRRLATKAYFYIYAKDTAILGPRIGEKDTIHVVVNGVCSVIQRVDMIHGKNNKGLPFIPYPVKKGHIPPGCFIRTHYLDVAHLKKGMACNLGESWHNRVLMALNDVTILYIPYNVIEEYDGRDSSWDEIKEFIRTNLPDEETLYAEYKTKVLWREYREKIREDIIFMYKESKKSMTGNIPINITHLLEKEEIK